MSEPIKRRGMSGKDVITVGIFSAIYFVINFAFMLLGGLHPLLWILMPGFIARAMFRKHFEKAGLV